MVAVVENPAFANWQPMCDILLAEPFDLRIHNELAE